MPRPPKQFDVWFVTATTVYKAVPYQVVADWVQQGRLGPGDMVRPAGSSDAWTRVDSIEALADYLPRAPLGSPVPLVASATSIPGTGPVVPATTPPAPPAEIDIDPLPRRRRADEDDDVDMIPLIDISIVLLVFFILIQASGVRQNVMVPDTIGGYATADPEALIIAIEPGLRGVPRYSLRKGEQPATPEDSGLESQEAVLSRLESRIPREKNAAGQSSGSQATSLPRVRIACHKDLPSQLVQDVVVKLRELKTQGRISGFDAEVKKD